MCSIDPAELPRAAMVYNSGLIFHRNESLLPKLSIHCPLTLFSGRDDGGTSADDWGARTEELTSGVSVYVQDMNSGNGAGCPGPMCGTVDAQLIYHGPDDGFETFCAWAQTSGPGYGSWSELKPLPVGGGCNPPVNLPRAGVHIQLPQPSPEPAGYSVFKGIAYRSGAL